MDMVTDPSFLIALQLFFKDFVSKGVADGSDLPALVKEVAEIKTVVERLSQLLEAFMSKSPPSSPPSTDVSMSTSIKLVEDHLAEHFAWRSAGILGSPDHAVLKKIRCVLSHFLTFCLF